MPGQGVGWVGEWVDNNLVMVLLVKKCLCLCLCLCVCICDCCGVFAVAVTGTHVS